MKKILFFRPMYYMGGTEIAILSLIKNLKGYDIYIGYTDDTSSVDLLNQYSAYAKVSKLSEIEDIEYDSLIICTPYKSVWDMITNIKRKNTYLWFHHFGDRGASIFHDERTYTQLDKIIVVSETVKNIMLRQKYGERIKDKIYVIYNILNVNEIINKSKIPIGLELSKTLNLVTVSRLCLEKGFKRILKLANALKDNNVDFKWFVIGGNYYKDVEGKIKDMFKDLDKYFVFYGFLDNPYNIIRQCDYLVLLSDNETWGLALTEAKILNVPCIVTDFEVAYEQIVDEKTGIIISRSERDNYQDKVDIILNKKEELKNNLNNFQFSNLTTLIRWKSIL